MPSPTPFASSAAAISAPRRPGSRRAIAISAGSAPAQISRETSSAIASASERVPAERSRVSPSLAASGCGSAAPNWLGRWKSSGLLVLAGSASVTVLAATPIRSRNWTSSFSRAARAVLPVSKGTATVTSAAAASAATSASWWGVRSSKP